MAEVVAVVVVKQVTEERTKKCKEPFCSADSQDAEPADVEPPPASVALSSSSARCFSSSEIIVSVLPRPMSSADTSHTRTHTHTTSGDITLYLLISYLVSWSLTSLLQHKYGYSRDDYPLIYELFQT